MTDEAVLIWEKVLAEAEKEISKPSFEAWLKLTKPLTIKNKSIIIEVPNDFTRHRIETRHKVFLENSIKRVSNKDYSIFFTCDHSISDNKQGDLPADFESENIINNSLPEDKKTNNNASDNYFLHNSIPWLNPKYSFDTFVVGSCNRLAHAASLAVAETPSEAYNPLFIYGGVGLGKTHLMHAISHYVINNHKNSRVFYLSSEKFMNEFINAIRDNKTVDFRNKYRNIDVLLIDDIQFLAGKERSQEEFFHTFNALHESNKQIIISSDRPPKDIPTIEDRLRSRFEWGLITDITKPDLETRIAILKKKAYFEQIHVQNDVINYIANKIETNIRELEGALIRVMAFSSLNNAPVDLKIADEALKTIIADEKNEVNVNHIIKVTSRYFGISEEDIKAKKRSRDIAFPRQIAMFLSRELTDTSLPKLGTEFGGKDHTTVIHACKKIKNSVESNPEVKEIVKRIRDDINGY